MSVICSVLSTETTVLTCQPELQAQLVSYVKANASCVQDIFVVNDKIVIIPHEGRGYEVQELLLAFEQHVQGQGS
jgi:hypothetical protein